MTGGTNLHVYPSPILNESRILKETRSAFATGLFDRIEVAGTWLPGLAREQQWHEGVTIRRFGADTMSSSLTSKLTKAGRLAKDVYSHYKRQPLSVVNCHSVAALPLCRALAHRTHAKLIYDTHELETEAVGMTGLKRPIAKALEAVNIRAVNHTFVVGNEIEHWYQDRYPGISIDTLYNFPSALDDVARLPNDYFHKQFGLTAGTKVFLYQGVLGPARGIEEIAEAFRRFPRPDHALVLMGYGEWENRVRELAAEVESIHFHAAVPPEELLSYSRCADVGFSIFEPQASLSYRFSAPNKLFQYLCAGLAVIASDVPEQAAVIRKFDAGVLIADFSPESIRAACDTVLSTSRAQGEQAVSGELMWEQYQPLIDRRYRELLGVQEG
jgi:glycosyltransferase involved in cell wall biosynthesis